MRVVAKEIRIRKKLIRNLRATKKYKKILSTKVIKQ